jgi:hypothetical protein
MPIHLSPVSRRDFLKVSVAAGVGLLVLPEWSAADSDPDFWALLADTHIAQDRAQVNRGVNMADNLRRVGEELRALKAQPAGVLINGDCAFGVGTSGDYTTLSELLKPLTETKLPIHATLGNHDHRDNFRAAMLERNPNARLLQSKHVSVIESPKANWFLLDSLDQTNVTPGKLGDEQREWLAKALDARPHKPALIVVHHNPLALSPGGLLDTEELFKILVPRKQVKAFIYGHVHHWNLEKRDDIHWMGLPPVAYVFQQGDPSGWVSVKLHDDGAMVELHSLDPNHPAHGKPTKLTWRTNVMKDSATTKRPKIAAIVTIYHKYSHAQHIVDRFLEGYGWNGRHHHPPMDLVSLYVDQVRNGDLSRERAARFPHMKIYPTVADALTLGGSDLGVDGVLLIGEHGNYRRNAKGQQLYPRYELFQQIVAVYRKTGRTAPLFNDKHLSWNWDWAREMYDTARAMGFAFMAGSSLPVTWRTPSLDMPLGARIREAMCVCYGGVDSYDFHGLETLQCMVERRQGGEKGVKWLQAYRGEKFWQAHEEGVWSRELFETCLSRSHTLTPAREGFNHVLPTVEQMRQIVRNPVAYHYEHRDGLKCTMILLNRLVQDFNFAAQLDDRVFSTQMYLPMPPARTTLANFFSPLNHHVEQMFLTGKATYPVERTLLTTGLTAAGVESLFQNQTRLETPHLKIEYQPTKESTFWRT